MPMTNTKIVALFGSLAAAAGLGVFVDGRTNTRVEDQLAAASDFVAEVQAQGAWKAEAGQCNAARVVIERPVGANGQARDQDEVLCRMCDRAPDLSKERRAPVVGQAIEVFEVGAPFPKPAGVPAIACYWRRPWPQELVDHLGGCACRPRSDVGGLCQVRGQPAPFAQELQPGAWSGACLKRPCGEHAGSAGSQGLNYSWMGSPCL